MEGVLLQNYNMYRITKNFRDKKPSRNVMQQHFAKKVSRKKGLHARLTKAVLNFAKKTFVTL